jgi:hypothetical protein
LIQIKARQVTNNHTSHGFYGDGFALSPEGSLLGLGVRAAHPFFANSEDILLV